MIIYKTREEIKKIEKADKILAEILDDLLPKYIKAGVTTYELDKIAEDYILSKGAKPGFKGYRAGYLTFPSTLCTSINEEVVHGIPSKKRKLKDGDIISVDVGSIVEGYYGDSARTYSVGKIDDIAKKLMDVTEKSLYIGIEQAKVGNRISDIGHAIQEYIELNGFGVVRDYCGHGVGRYLHEDPQIPNFGPVGRGSKIEDGMVIAIEPMATEGSYKVKTLHDGWTVITKDKKRAAHFEHSIAIIDGKPVILSKL
ncbi:type I methionyl aminopeptidase [Haliovirga abyssi]|uniref:Methionine aminopeptidase n=1 Tax=Haliovirga abyssi TaxID=2996794 RepID=A0AAU9DZU8_9FUSO|nr:type I methionyl aminopeptidase [Haliovirga abyssi]BDU49545.1 methionine aminopeptidase [Haliovirga abyssi]